MALLLPEETSGTPFIGLCQKDTNARQKDSNLHGRSDLEHRSALQAPPSYLYDINAERPQATCSFLDVYAGQLCPQKDSV